MTRNPSLTAKQLQLLIDQLLAEPPDASRLADDIVDELVYGGPSATLFDHEPGDAALARLLFKSPGIAAIMALPAEDQRKIMAHLGLIIARTDAGVARLAQATALDQAGLARHAAARAKARADEAENSLLQSRQAEAVAAEVDRRLAELAAVTRPPEPQPPAPPATTAAPLAAPSISPPTRSTVSRPKASELIEPYLEWRRVVAKKTHQTINQHGPQNRRDLAGCL